MTHLKWTDPAVKSIVHVADKLAYRKDYACLVPGCTERAVNCHAIPRALLVDALAEDRKVITYRHSFASLMRVETGFEAIELVPTGVNKACLFKGYCSEHDTRLFAPIEVATVDQKTSLAHAFHLRGLSLEFCRNRLAAEFGECLYRLAEERRVPLQPPAYQSYVIAARRRMAITLDYMFTRVFADYDGISFWMIPFNRNLGISCCGIFSQSVGDREAPIAYNLISYRDSSILVLTTFSSTMPALDGFLSTDRGAGLFGVEQLINELAFLKGEEPVLSPRLWYSLSPDEKQSVGEALRPLWLRSSEVAPRIIKLRTEDVGAVVWNPS